MVAENKFRRLNSPEILEQVYNGQVEIPPLSLLAQPNLHRNFRIDSTNGA
jgi:hypothetical protein